MVALLCLQDGRWGALPQGWVSTPQVLSACTGLGRADSRAVPHTSKAQASWLMGLLGIFLLPLLRAHSTWSHFLSRLTL